MFQNTPFEAIAKNMSESAQKFGSTAMQDAVRPVQDNLQAWANLAQNQAKEAQGVLTEAVESMKVVKDPQAAFEVMKASAEAGIALFTKNLKDAASLSVGQFHSTVDAIEKAHPAPENFAPLAKGLKAAVSTAEATLDSALEQGASVAASVASAAKAKKAR